jgi:hypothetical protein
MLLIVGCDGGGVFEAFFIDTNYSITEFIQKRGFRSCHTVDVLVQVRG